MNEILKDNVTKEIGTRVREARKNAGIGLKEAADSLFIAQNTLSQYENAKRAIPSATLIAMTKLYKTNANYLLLGEDASSISSQEKSFINAYNQLDDFEKGRVYEILKNGQKK